MGLISAIKSVLGLGDSGDRSPDQSTGTNVTVEREADATSERAVKKSDATEVTFGDESGTTADEDPDQSVEEEPDQSAEEEPGDDGEPETVDGMPDAADAETTGETEDAADAGTAAEDGVEEGPEDADTPAEDDGATSVEEIRGIGSAYAERLADAGVHTVSELATADAAELGSETGVGESRVANWIERANEY